MGSVATFAGLALAAFAAGFVTSHIVSYILTVMFVPRGNGRVVVNAILFRYIWSFGFNQPGLMLGKIIVALVLAGICLAAFSTGTAFLIAAVAASVIAAIALTVVFFTA